MQIDFIYPPGIDKFCFYPLKFPLIGLILPDVPGVSALDEVTIVVNVPYQLFLASLLLQASLLLEGVPAFADSPNVARDSVVDAIPAVAGVPVIAATPYVAGIPGVAGVGNIRKCKCTYF